MKLQATLSLATLTVALFVAGCSSAGYVDGPVLTSPRPPLFGGGGMDAVVGGTLDFDGACLRLVSGDIAYPVVWPHGASWQIDPQSVEVNGQRIQPGMQVTGTGGFIWVFEIESAVGSQVAEAAEQCAGATGEIAFFNLGSSVDITSD